MKKLFVLLLSLVLLVSLTACGNKKNDEQGYEVTPSDLTTEDETTAGPVLDENQTQLDDFAQAEEVLGSAIVWPEELEPSLIILDSDKQISVEFTYKEVSFTGRYYAGEKSDLSGLSGMKFVTTETKTLGGVNMQLRYQDESNSFAMGVAEGYSADKNISFMVVQSSQATSGDLLSEVTEMFINAVQ